MVDEVGKTGAISNQKFSQKGMQLSQLKENKQIYEFFKKAGLSDGNYVYATDIQNLIAKFDSNENGKLSVREAKEMGLQGSRKEIKQAVKLMNDILETEINASQGVYPTKIDDNTTAYYDKEGKIQYQAQTVQDGGQQIEKFTFYRDGDEAKIASYAEKSGNSGYIMKFNEAGLPEQETYSNNGNIQTTSYEYNAENQLSKQTTEAQGTRVVTEFDAYKRPVKITEQNAGSDISTVVTNQFDDETGTLTQTIKNNPELLKDGIMETVSQYTIDQESGKTDALLYRKETGIDGKEREFSQSGDEEVVEKRDGYTVTTKWHENGKTSTVQDGDKTHTIEYDKDGNTYVYVKNGETFKATAERLLGKDASEDQISAFRELNKDLIKTYGKDKKVEAFNVGEKIRVPMELQYNADTKAILTVDPKAEIDAWKKGVKPSGGSQSGETPIDETPIDETPIDIPDGSKIDAAAAKPVTLDVSKKQLDEKGIKYNVKGNELSFVDKQGRKVVMSYENGLKKHETAYPDDAVNMQGEQLTGRRYYDKVYENGVLKKEMVYHDTNPSKIAIQRGYKDGVIYREVKCMDDEQKNIAMAERMNAGEKINAVEFMHTPQLTERSEFVNGEKVKTIHYRNGDLEKIDTLETFKDGYTTTTVYENGDTSKILSIATTYPDYSNVVLKRYEAGNLDVVTELSEMNSKQNFTPVYDNKGNVVQYTKADGTVLDANGNLKSCELADNLYRQLKGYSDNDITEQMLSQIDESNIVDILEGFDRHSPDEPLFEYVNNEWGFGLGRPVMDPILGKLLKLGSQYGITNTKLQELLNNNKDNERSSYNNDEIKQLNENIPLVVKALRNKYKALIKENM